MRSLASTVVNLASQDFQHLIGDIGEGIENWEGSAAHMALHSLVGCVTNLGLGGNCAAGAISGIIQSIYAGAIAPSEPQEEDFASNEDYHKAYKAWQQEHLATVAFLGSLGGYFFSGGEAINVNNAGSIAQSGLLNNYLTHAQLEALSRDLQLCNGDETCEKNVAIKYKELSDINTAAMKACGLNSSCFAKHLNAIKKAQNLAEQVLNMQLAGLTSTQILGSIENQHVQDFQHALSSIMKDRYLKQVCPNLDANCLGREDVKEDLSLIADFTPVIGDVKAFAEAESPSDYFLAVVAIVPLLGDLVAKGVKGFNRAEVAKLIDDLPEGWEVDADGNLTTQDGFPIEITENDGNLTWTINAGDVSGTGSVWDNVTATADNIP